ncbi:MAG: heparinase II/III family protein [Prevotella sp.]|nr:heparinase II/III family protein [Prevotella sp.]
MRSIVALFLLLSALSTSAGLSVAERMRLKRQTDACLDSCRRQPDWLLSRLQMYWASHAADVYVDGESFSHLGGERAQWATVKYNGSRSMATDYDRPPLERLVPYDDDERGSVTFVNKKSGKMERTVPSKTGCNISSVNRQILGVARDAARLYADGCGEDYGRMAFGVFDTYLKGIYGRHVPIDLNHGHQQTLVGLTTFEVIHEDAINELTEMYPLLTAYPSFGVHRHIYDAALKKWAENIIANGVPHNNWNLIQATFIMRIALVLQADSCYADGCGRDYYLDYIVRRQSIRQWGVRQLAAYGFDPSTHIWCESPGYSVGVVADFVILADRMDREAGIDLFREVPAIVEAVFAQPQYFFPNRMICGFGDTHPEYLRRDAIEKLRAYAQRHGDGRLEQRADSLLKAVHPDAPADLIGRYVSPTFHSPKVSWLVQRTGMDRRHDLMISLNGSLGNHQHANGISMELYGRGYVVGPDAGIGRSLYSGLDYSEYYSQFPAHNTVCVDGMSSYPVMMSQHGFEVQFCGHSADATCSQVGFLEPETHAEQVRTNGIVKTQSGGYYVDIFRSRRKDGKDRFHDYFYHNIGQEMELLRADGIPLPLQPTEELAFAGGHLYAYSYIYDKKSTVTSADVKTVFRMKWADGRHVTTTMWMRGDENREVFRALSPANLEYERHKSLYPYDVAQQPVLTYVARQHGNAWDHPFVAVFEPTDHESDSVILAVSFFTPEGRDAVGIKVQLKSGQTDYIFSAPVKTRMAYQGMEVNACYAVVRDGTTLISY